LVFKTLKNQKNKKESADLSQHDYQKQDQVAKM
jgi:hypothetical protein